MIYKQKFFFEDRVVFNGKGSKKPSSSPVPKAAPKTSKKPTQLPRQRKALTPNEKSKRESFLRRRALLRKQILATKESKQKETSSSTETRLKTFLKSIRPRTNSSNNSQEEQFFVDLHEWRFEGSGDWDSPKKGNNNKGGKYWQLFYNTMSRIGSPDFKSNRQRRKAFSFFKRMMKTKLPKNLTSSEFQTNVISLLKDYRKNLNNEDSFGSNLGGSDISRANNTFSKSLEKMFFTDDEKIKFSDIPGVKAVLESRLKSYAKNDKYFKIISSLKNKLKAANDHNAITPISSALKKISDIKQMRKKIQDGFKKLPKNVQNKLKKEYNNITISTSTENLQSEKTSLKKVLKKVNEALKIAEKKKKKATELSKFSTADQQVLKDSSVLRSKMSKPLFGKLSAAWYVAKNGISDAALKELKIDPDKLPLLAVFRFLSGTSSNKWSRVPVVGGLIAGAKKLFSKASNFFSKNKLKLNSYKPAANFLKNLNINDINATHILNSKVTLKKFFTDNRYKKFKTLRERIKKIVKKKETPLSTTTLSKFLTSLKATDITPKKKKGKKS